MSETALSGVFSGIDSDVLIARSMAFNRIPLSRLNSQKSQWQAHMSENQNKSHVELDPIRGLNKGNNHLALHIARSANPVITSKLLKI